VDVGFAQLAYTTHRCGLKKLEVGNQAMVFGAFAKLPVCPSAWNISAPSEWIFIEFDIRVFLEKSGEKIQFSLKSYNNDG